jgi:hypothetical protein
VTEKVLISTYQRMTALVDPDNPAFSGHFKGKPKKHTEVYAIISNGVTQWREKFKVSSLKVAEEQIKEVLQFFNDTRRPEHPMEKERSFVEFYQEDEEVSRHEDDYGMSGWLDPDGVFHPCGFGEHVKYALDLFNDEDNRWKNVGSDEMEELATNQHIPLSNGEQSTGGFISILGQLTPPQVTWFNRFFYKLSSTQKTALSRAAKGQGIQLKYHW